MAQQGLTYNKITILNKEYKDITPSLQLDQLFGKLIYRGINEVELAYEDDTTRPRNPDGNYPQIPTGEVLSVKLAIKSEVQHETLEFSILEMLESDIQALGLKFGDEVELDNIIVTYSAVSGGVYKLFANTIKKKGAPAPKADKPKGNHE